MPKGATQHHCPVCFHIAKPRCYARKHLVQCETHTVFHSSRSQCVQCHDDELRAERVQRSQRAQSADAGDKRTRKKKGQKRRESSPDFDSKSEKIDTKSTKKRKR